jgi:hypothetical protein
LAWTICTILARPAPFLSTRSEVWGLDAWDRDFSLV